MPALINDEWAWDNPAISYLLEQAAVRLGELNAYARFVPDIDQFIQLHVTKEALLSSRIESTQTEMDEALLPKEEIALERKDDWQEVNNYIQAMNQAIANLKKLPISSHLIRKTHEALLQSVRGANKLSGANK